MLMAPLWCGLGYRARTVVVITASAKPAFTRTFGTAWSKGTCTISLFEISGKTRQSSSLSSGIFNYKFQGLYYPTRCFMERFCQCQLSNVQ